MTAPGRPEPDSRTAAMRAGRQADTERRRQRVLKILQQDAAAGTEISVSAIARRAGVDPHLPLPAS